MLGGPESRSGLNRTIHSLDLPTTSCRVRSAKWESKLNDSGVSVACPHCGAVIKAAARLCKYCRRPIDEIVTRGTESTPTVHTVAAPPPKATNPPPAATTRWFTSPAALMLCGALLSAVAAFSKGWFSLTGNSDRRDALVHVGLASWSACNEVDGCNEGTLEATSHLGVLSLLREGNAHQAWVRAGSSAQGAHVFACLFVVLCIAIHHYRPSTQRLVLAFLAAILIQGYALLCGWIFVFSKPETFQGLSPSWAWLASSAGAFLAMAGALLVVRRLVDESGAISLLDHLKTLIPVGYGGDRSESGAYPRATTPTTVPACPKCQAPTAWRSQHRKFFCAACSIYVEQGRS